MADLATELRSDITLSPGILARTFTFYDKDQYKEYSAHESTTPGCLFDPTFFQLQIFNPECFAPASDADHQVAQDWISGLALTPNDRIVVVGHSYGGNRALLFAQQLINSGYTVDGLATIDPIDWDACHIFDASGSHIPDAHCNFSGVAYLTPDNINYVLSYTQTQSTWLDGYHLANQSFAYMYTVLNDPSCLPNPLNPFAGDYFCSHVNIATNPTVHLGVIQLAKSVLQDTGQSISQIQASSITTSSAVVSWTTEAYTTGGQVIFSLQANFGTSQVAQESGVPSQSHSVTLEGLQANQIYYFKVQITSPTSSVPSSIMSQVESFSTTPTIPSVKATSPSLTLGTAGATLEFILTDSGAPVTSVIITSAKIGAVSTTTQLPLPISDLGPIQSPLITLVFPATIGTTGSTVIPVVTLKYSSGTIMLAVPRTQIQ